jgi:hypothetical protein
MQHTRRCHGLLTQPNVCADLADEGFGWLDPQHCYWGERGIYFGVMSVSGTLLLSYFIVKCSRRYCRRPRVDYSETPLYGALIAIPSAVSLPKHPFGPCGTPSYGTPHVAHPHMAKGE